MASFKIHEDQENRVPELRQKQHNVAMAGYQKRSVLGVIDNNKQRANDGNNKGKKPLGLANSSSNVQKNNENEDTKKNPVIPVAQFEAIKVYEDVNYEEKLKEKSTSRVYKGTTEDRFYSKAEAAEIEKKAKEEKKKKELTKLAFMSSPMSIEKTFDNSLQLAEEVIRKSARTRELFYEMDEYRDDIYKYLRELELRNRPKPGYMQKQPDITSNMRTILVDWLVEVTEEYKMHTETLYLAINYIDRFLSYMSVVRGKLQLVGTAAMFMASKYEEIYPPDISEFVYITDDTYNKRQLIRMEHLIVKVLNFDLSVPTPLSFIHLICISCRLTEKTMFLAMYLSELSMLNGELYLEFLPSTIAAGAIALARHILGERAWTEDLASNSGYQFPQLIPCVEFLNSMFKMAPSHMQHAIQDKYSAQKFLHVSTIKATNKPVTY